MPKESLAHEINMLPQDVVGIATGTPAGVGAAQGRFLRRTMGIAALGGATLDNEENYLIKKLFTGLGIVQIENQARI